MVTGESDSDAPSNMEKALVSEVTQWIQERTVLVQGREVAAAVVSDHDKRIGEIDKRIAAAAVLSHVVDEMKQELEAESGKVPLTKAIVDVLTTVFPGRPVDRNLLKKSVTRVGYPVDRLNTNPNYLYIAIRRLLDRDLIKEEPEGHFVLKQSEKPGGVFS